MTGNATAAHAPIVQRVMLERIVDELTELDRSTWTDDVDVDGLRERLADVTLLACAALDTLD